MWNPFKKTEQAPTRPVRAPTSMATSEELVKPGQAIVPKLVDYNFLALLLGGGVLQDKALSASENKALMSMHEWVRSPQAIAALPRLPATLPKLMGLLRRDDVSIPELAEHLSQDPTLLGEMMRIANSAFYRTARPVASIADAVHMIGYSGLRQLVTRVAMGPVFGGQSGYFSKLASGPLWEQAQRCASACAWLRRAESDAFDAYLAGIVAGTGLIAVLRMLDREMVGQEVPDAINFYAAVHDCSLHLSSSVALHWSFPQQVVDAMRARESHEHGLTLDSFAIAVQRADRCAKLVMLHQLEAMDEVTSTEDAACVQEILHSFDKPLDSTVMGDLQ